MSTLQKHTSIPDCPITFSFNDLKETPEVKRWLASPEGKRKTEMSIAHLFIPDEVSALRFIGFLPFQIVHLLVSIRNANINNLLIFE
jgi:hypothetical protein